MEVITCRCGTNLGEIIPIWDFLVDKIKKDTKASPGFATINVENLGEVKLNIELKALLDMLHLDRMCCRMDMLGKSKVVVL